MKAIFAIIILPLIVLANPVPAPEPKAEPESAHIEKRAVTCALTGSDVRYHQKPSTTSTADGQFGATGTEVPFSCYTTGSDVNNDTLWNKIASGKGAGDYVTDYYITRECSDKITTLC